MIPTPSNRRLISCARIRRAPNAARGWSYLRVREKRRVAAWLVLLAAAVMSPWLHAEEVLTFEQHVRPIFKAHCFPCHGEGDEAQAGLDLRLRRLAVRGGESGPAIAPERPNESLLLRRVMNGEMPPKGTVSARDRETIERWIAGGAKTVGPEPDDASQATISATEREYWAFQPLRLPLPPDVALSDKLRSPVDAFIASQLERQGLRLSEDARLEQLVRRSSLSVRGLPPDPAEVEEVAADDRPDALERWIDRLLASPRLGEHWGRHWLDTAGYCDSDGYSETDPPRPYAYKYRDYVIRSMNADKPWDEFIVEQLAGDELLPQPFANLSARDQDRLIATGFLRTVPDGTASGGAVKEAGNAVVAEALKVFSSSLLGLTVGCAQCHDHRYDPISQEDYYRLRAIFEPAFDLSAWRNPAQRLVSLATEADRAKSAEIETQAVQAEAKRTEKQNDYIAKTLEKELAKIADDKRDRVREARNAPVEKRTPEQLQLLKEYPSVNVDAGSLYLYDNQAAEDLKKDAETIANLRKTKPVEDFISCLAEVPGKLPETRLFRRGDPDQARQVLAPAELSVLVSHSTELLPTKDAQLATSGRRLAYARQLTSGRHPLVGRVIVNQFWHHHFGRGIVATPGDFGVLGERPTHPELLDWLAVRLAGSQVAGGETSPPPPPPPIADSSTPWSAKRLHRMILCSTTWRQSSRRRQDLEQADPDNRLLGRYAVRRLEAESVRDSMLAVNGMLVLNAFGPAVPVMEDEVGQIVVGIENKNGENRPGPVIPMHGEDCRRSVYIQLRRTRLLGMLDTFDLASLEPNCSARNASTVTPQSLLMMNSDFAVEASRDFARRLQLEAPDSPGSAAVEPPNGSERIQRAWALALGRSARPSEVAAAQQFIADQTRAFTERAALEPDASKRLDPVHWAWAGLCQAIFSSNEFLYME
jgi:hypothetical protein